MRQPVRRTGDRPLIAVLVYIGMVAAVVSSLGAPLIPTIARDEGISLASAQWSLTVTLLVAAVATPVMGRLGDGPARRPMVLGGLASVLVGSVLAALPFGYGLLIGGRALMGVGLGLIPLTMATARDSLRGQRQRSTVAMLSITTVAGVGLGYPLTGLIAQHLGLHAGFWFGAGVSAVALLLALWCLPSSSRLPRRRLDVRGALLLAGALACLLLALSEAESWGWGSPGVLSLALAGAALLGVWVRHELRTPLPLVDLRLVRSRTVLTADVTALCAGIGMYLLLSLVTRFVQTPASAGYGFGASVALSGLVLMPFSVASVAASRVAPLIARHLSPDLVLPIGSLLFLAATATFALRRDNLLEVFVTMTVAGLGVGCSFAAMPALILRTVPAHETGSAMSFNQVLRYVGYSVGSALSATVLEAHTPAGQSLPAAGGYSAAAALGCAVWLLAVVVALVLPRARRRRAAVAPPAGADVASRPVTAGGRT